MAPLHNKTVVITGASSGIGAATALMMARRGARVILLARSRERLAAAADAIHAQGGAAHVFPTDLSDVGIALQTADQIIEALGTPDIIVNNAGAGRFLSLEETDPVEAERMMRVPYLAAFTMTRAFLPGMLARDSGFIVNITSPAGYVSFPGAVGYSVARWAMRGFAESLWADLHYTNIRAALLVAGKTSSDYFANNPGSEARLPKIARLFPVVTPEQVAEEVVSIVAKGKKFAVIPRALRPFFLASRLFPGVVRSLVYRTGYRRPGSLRS